MAESAPRVFPDSNVLIEGLFSPWSASRAILIMARVKLFRLVLSPYVEREIERALLGRLNRAGHTIVMITHLMWVAAEYAARCVVMQAGRIVADDRTRAVFAQPERMEPLGLRVPQIPRFTQYYGRTLLTGEELEAYFRIA